MILKIALFVILLLLVITTVQKFIYGFFRKKLAERIKERFRGRQIIMQALNANYFGRKIRGGRQIRGNGALVLLPDELWFLLAAPSREISIPISSIKSVDLKMSFLGKSVFRKLLTVSFENQGQIETIAWYVPNVEMWRQELESLIVRN